MGFRGEAFAFESPSAGVAAVVSRWESMNDRGGDGDPCRRRPVESIGLEHALGRVLAEDIRANRDSPGFDHSSMDGYAVRAADLVDAARRGAERIRVRVSVESRIGAAPPPLPLVDGVVHGARIATGAAIPPGADAVVKREDVDEHGPGDGTVGGEAIWLTPALAAGIAPGDHVRRRGENARAGEAFLGRGEVLSAASVGAAAAVGCFMPRVFTRLRVALFTTGDELVDARETPGPFQVRDSNTAALRALLASSCWIELIRATHLTDDSDLSAALGGVAGPPFDAEAIILTGGVSMGRRDPVRAAVERTGAEIVFHGMPQRPGKPMLAALLGTSANAAVPIFGLPGNPVSAMVTCTRIVLPVLARCAGAGRPPASLAPRSVGFPGDDGQRLDLWWHRPVRLRTRDDGSTEAEVVETSGSGDVIAAGRSDGFIELPPAAGPAAALRSRGTVLFYGWPT